MTSVAIFFDIDAGRFLLPVQKCKSVNTHLPHTHKSAAIQIKLVLTITGGPFPLSLVMRCKAEHRNSDEDGQDDIRGNNAYYRPHVYNVTGTTFCGRERRL